MTIRLLRGRVIIREDFEARHRHYKNIVIPDVYFGADERDGRADRRKFHVGSVVAKGPPARTKQGAEVPHGFEVGDDVVFVWNHLERAWSFPWYDGTTVCAIPQECVMAVVERPHDA